MPFDSGSEKMVAQALGVWPPSIDGKPPAIGLMNPRVRRSRGVLAAALLAAILACMPSSATAGTLKFAFTPIGSLAALQTSNPTLYGNVTGGFTTAGNIWAGYFHDDMTIRPCGIHHNKVHGVALARINGWHKGLDSNGFTIDRNDLIACLQASHRSRLPSHHLSDLRGHRWLTVNGKQ